LKNKDLIEYKRAKAKEVLDDAKLLFKEKRLFSAVNRIYYSLFYEVEALLLTEGFSSSKHSGVLSIFNKEFVKKGIVSIELGKFFGRMFEFREKGDYAPFVDFDENKVSEWINDAEKFLAELDILIMRRIGSNTRK